MGYTIPVKGIDGTSRSKETPGVQLAILGPPGSGKSTVGKALAEKYEVPFVSSGDIARQLAEMDPTTSLALKAGSMAPEESMRGLVRENLEKANTESGGYILEGFPRTTAQWVALQMWEQMPMFITLGIKTADSLLRLVQRARDDDTPDAIERRWRTYESETLPLIEFLYEAAYNHIINVHDLDQGETFEAVDDWVSRVFR